MYILAINLIDLYYCFFSFYFIGIGGWNTESITLAFEIRTVKYLVDYLPHHSCLHFFVSDGIEKIGQHLSGRCKLYI